MGAIIFRKVSGSNHIFVTYGQYLHFSLLYACKDLNTFDLDHWKVLRDTYSIFRGIPRSCFWSLNPDVLEAQKAEIKNALDSIRSLDDFAHQLPFNPNTSHRLVRLVIPSGSRHA